VIASPTLYATQTVTGTIRGFEAVNPKARFFIHYFDETDQLARLDGAWIEIAQGDNPVAFKVPDTGGGRSIDWVSNSRPNTASRAGSPSSRSTGPGLRRT
jgi:hypothetical protein